MPRYRDRAEGGRVTAQLPEATEPVLLQREDTGRALYTSHHLKLNGRGWRGVTIFVVVSWLVLGLPATIVHGIGAGLPVAITIVLIAVVYAWGVWSFKIRVCEHAIILDSTRLKRATYIIPYTSIDADSFIVVPPPRPHSANHGYLPMVVWGGKWPNPAMNTYLCANLQRHWNGNYIPMNRRSAAWNRYRVSFRGLQPALASPYYRSGGLVPLPADRKNCKPRLAVLSSAWLRLRDQPGYGPAVDYHGIPVLRWFVGTDHPERLLRAVEQAMTAAGIAGATGLADRALSNPRTYPKKQIPQDPALW